MVSWERCLRGRHKENCQCKSIELLAYGRNFYYAPLGLVLCTLTYGFIFYLIRHELSRRTEKEKEVVTSLLFWIKPQSTAFVFIYSRIQSWYRSAKKRHRWILQFKILGGKSWFFAVIILFEGFPTAIKNCYNAYSIIKQMHAFTKYQLESWTRNMQLFMFQNCLFRIVFSSFWYSLFWKTSNRNLNFSERETLHWRHLVSATQQRMFLWRKSQWHF